MEDPDPRLRDPNEFIRTHRGPDWLQIFLGTTVNFAFMGFLALLGGSLRLLTIHPDDSVAMIVVDLLWLLGSVTFGSFLGGFVAGYTQSRRSNAAAVMNGLLVTQMTILMFFLAGFFSIPVLPGVTFSLNPGGTSNEGLLWWAMMISLPDLFASTFGAIAGNRFASRIHPEEPQTDLGSDAGTHFDQTGSKRAA